MHRKYNRVATTTVAVAKICSSACSEYDTLEICFVFFSFLRVTFIEKEKMTHTQFFLKRKTTSRRNCAVRQVSSKLFQLDNSNSVNSIQVGRVMRLATADLVLQVRLSQVNRTSRVVTFSYLTTSGVDQHRSNKVMETI